MAWFSYADRKSLGFRVSMEIDLIFVRVGDRNLLDFSVGTGIDLVLCGDLFGDRK